MGLYYTINIGSSAFWNLDAWIMGKMNDHAMASFNGLGKVAGNGPESHKRVSQEL